MRVGTLNVKSNPLMPQTKVLHDMLKMAPLAGVIFWQEIQPKRYREALRALKGLGHSGTGSEVPITWDLRNFRLIDSGQVKVHGGRFKITPSRFISWAILEFGPNNDRAVFMCSHTVSSAWSGRKVAFIPWRRKMWNKHFAMWHDLIERFHALGYPVIGGGDLNRNGTAAFYPGMKWLEHNGYDNIFVVPGADGPVFEKVGSYVSTKGDFYTDHPAKVVTLKYK